MITLYPLALGACVLALALLTTAAVLRATAPTALPLRRGVGPIEPARSTRYESPESAAARICRDLAVATAGGQRPVAVCGRLRVEPARLSGEDVWQVRIGAVVRRLCPDLEALEAAVAHELRQLEVEAEERDCRAGVGR